MTTFVSDLHSPDRCENEDRCISDVSSPSRWLKALIALLAVTAIVLAAAVHQHNTPKARFGRFCRALQSPPGRDAVPPITVGTPTVGAGR